MLCRLYICLEKPCLKIIKIFYPRFCVSFIFLIGHVIFKNSLKFNLVHAVLKKIIIMKLIKSLTISNKNFLVKLKAIAITKTN